MATDKTKELARFSGNGDPVSLYRRGIGAGLLALARKRGWDVKKAARAMGSSENHAVAILNNEGGKVPLESLIDMATFAGIVIEMNVKIPE